MFWRLNPQLDPQWYPWFPDRSTIGSTTHDMILLDPPSLFCQCYAAAQFWVIQYFCRMMMQQDQEGSWLPSLSVSQFWSSPIPSLQGAGRIHVHPRLTGAVSLSSSARRGERERERWNWWVVVWWGWSSILGTVGCCCCCFWWFWSMHHWWCVHTILLTATNTTEEEMMTQIIHFFKVFSPPPVPLSFCTSIFQITYFSLPFSWIQLSKEQCGQHIEWYCTFLAMGALFLIHQSYRDVFLSTRKRESIDGIKTQKNLDDDDDDDDHPQYLDSTKAHLSF